MLLNDLLTLYSVNGTRYGSLIQKSFTVCGIPVATNRLEAREIHCLKGDGATPEAKEIAMTDSSGPIPSALWTAMTVRNWRCHTLNELSPTSF